MILIIFFCVALCSYRITHGLVSGAIPLTILDHPNQRSLHTKVVPRTGGVAILVSILSGVLAAWLMGYAMPAMLQILVALLLIAVCSFIDDLKGLSVLSRLCVHLLAVGLVIHAGFVIHNIGTADFQLIMPSVIAIVLTTLFMIWSINLYNFMDGMDGFAAGMTIIGFGTFAMIGLLQSDLAFVCVNACLAASVLGFWFYNFPPAKIFMGDLGSSVLGFCFAVVSLWGVSANHFSIWIPCIIFSPFIVDATYTLLKRAFAGERFWEAHKTHFYQRLVEAGNGHKKVVLAEYALMAVCALIALLLVGYEHVKNVQLVGILLTSGLYTAIIVILNNKLRS